MVTKTGSEAEVVYPDKRQATIPSSELHRALKTVSIAASTDPERVNMYAVHFDGSDELVITATNGHWMAQWTCEPSEAPSLRSSMFVSLVDIKRLLPLLAADAKTVNLATIDFGSAMIEFTDGTMVQLTVVQADPPGYNAMWPKDEATGVPCFGLGAKLIGNVAKAFVTAHPDANIWVQVRGALDPLVIGSELVTELRALVMPVRLMSEEEGN